MVKIVVHKSLSNVDKIYSTYDTPADIINAYLGWIKRTHISFIYEIKLLNWIERGWNPCGMQFVFISEYVYLFVCVVSIVLFTNIFMQILMINFHQEGSINFINVYLRFIFFNKDLIYLTRLFNHAILFL